MQGLGSAKSWDERLFSFFLIYCLPIVYSYPIPSCIESRNHHMIDLQITKYRVKRKQSTQTKLPGSPNTKQKESLWHCG